MATEIRTDEALMEAIKQGNRVAFAQLVKRHSTRYYTLAYRYLFDQATAEDIVQTAFLKIWENPHRWKEKKGAQFTTWFYRMVVNLCLDTLKKHRALPLAEDYDAKDETRNQEEGLLKKEEQKYLAQNIAQLPKRQKTAIILCVYEQMSHQQAAQVMKINIKALQSLLMRAKTKLKDTMQERGSL